jgi:hypothetical protein
VLMSSSALPPPKCFALPDYPGERLIACRNPHLAEQRARTRQELLAATETALAPLLTAVAEGRRFTPRGGGPIYQHQGLGLRPPECP